MEALAAGLGVVVVSGKANLDLDKEFITVIPEDKINDIDFVEDAIIKNREYSINNREEIFNTLSSLSGRKFSVIITS